MAVETLVDVCNRLESEGYTQQCRSVKDGLRFLPDAGTYSPDEVHVDRVIRLEGTSVPSEQSLVFALSTPDRSVKATFCVAFGPAMDPLDVDVLQRLESRSAEAAAKEA